MNSSKKELSKRDFLDLKHILKQYANWYKALYHFNPANADEFQKKQEFYFKKRDKPSESHMKKYPNCHNVFKMETKFYIPKENMNNIEKNLYEIYESFFRPINLNQMLLFFEGKFEKIKNKGESEGMILTKESEKELMHRLLLEGMPFYIVNILKQTLKKYEGSISEQPMLLANPSAINDKRMVNFLSGENIQDLINGKYTIMDKNIYENIDLNNYEIYNQFKYIYMEGLFEDESINDNLNRSDYVLNFSINYFEKSKHKIVSTLTQAIYAIPFELNMKYPIFQLQINDYIQCSYFRENFSYIGKCYDSSFDHDTGKKLTYMVVLFPDEVELSKRICHIKLYDQINSELIQEVNLTKPLSGILIKSRNVFYEVNKHDFPFIIMFYFIHGPIDKEHNF